MLSGLRNFFIAFLISVTACGFGAYFLINFITEAANFSESEDMPGIDTEDSVEEPDDTDTGEFYKFTALIIGIDDGDSQDPGITREEDKIKEADAVILLNINSRTKTFMTSYLPRDMKVDVCGYTLRLGAVYAEHGSEMFIRTVRAYTGIMPDFYCVVDYDGIIALFDVLGRIDYNVPMNMYYMPEPYNFHILSDEEKEELEPEIDLRAGMSRLDGEEVVQLLRFRGYGGSEYNYLQEETSREAEHKNFLQEVVRQKLTFENLGRAREIYDAITESIVETNMQLEDFGNFTSLIFGFSDFEPLTIEYPGSRSFQDGVYFFVPNHPGAIRFYAEYR
ncbi:MAG: LCP family protein [Oscillospiraceae bacterium]|nr:LCP family protein [Oscillospiraceae bacterium]